MIPIISGHARERLRQSVLMRRDGAHEHALDLLKTLYEKESNPTARAYIACYIAEVFRHGMLNYAQARGHYEETLRYYPNNRYALVGLGVCCPFLNDLDCAEDSFQKCLQKDPDNRHALRGMDTLRSKRDWRKGSHAGGNGSLIHRFRDVKPEQGLGNKGRNGPGVTQVSVAQDRPVSDSVVHSVPVGVVVPRDQTPTSERMTEPSLISEPTTDLVPMDEVEITILVNGQQLSVQFLVPASDAPLRVELVDPEREKGVGKKGFVVGRSIGTALTPM